MSFVQKVLNNSSVINAGKLSKLRYNNLGLFMSRLISRIFM